ncbi:MAG: RagB/SusD family nutrient uptake outer membrane protein [Bacteroidia bacterium]|nr:RagB/SusD family nutrient uptake outer membrane protein [Bacteroidia bacterium]
MNRLMFIYISILALTAISCEGFLDRQPLDQISTESFYQTEEEANLAALAIYSPMLDVEWQGKGWMITEIPSDNTQAGGTDPDFTPIDNFSVSADNLPVANYWAFHYRCVVLANVVIEKVGNMSIEQATINRLIAEARFLRAFSYFDLVRIYGGVPLVLSAPEFGDDFLLPRATVAEVYEVIEEDLLFAQEHLPARWSGIDIGRASKGAAMALLAKVYLTRRDYLGSKTWSKAVMDMGIYQLMPNYSDNFELATSDNNAEGIFQIQLTGCKNFGTGNAKQAFFAPWGEGITKDRDGWGSQIPTGPILSNPGTTIFEAFEEGDLRRDVSMMTSGVYYPTINPQDGGYTYPAQGASATLCNIKKYVVGSGSNICFMSTPQNSHEIRYADVLLTFAESIMEIEGGVTKNPEALTAYNEVRQRAGLEAVTEFNREDILHERRVEFAFEGQRWFDLLRSGRAVEIMSLHGKNPSNEKLLFPIPSSELKINPNLEQNPGY